MYLNKKRRKISQYESPFAQKHSKNYKIIVLSRTDTKKIWNSSKTKEKQKQNEWNYTNQPILRVVAEWYQITNLSNMTWV